MIFDLDDTLYRESAYRIAAYQVASLMVTRFAGIQPSELVRELIYVYDSGCRLHVFQTALRRSGLPKRSAEYLARNIMVPAYQHCKCSIGLFPSAERVLRELCKLRVPIGLVTNGSSATQRNKLNLLGLEHTFDCVVITGELFDRSMWKPHPAPFLYALGELGVCPQQCLVVGDSPERDMAGALEAGCRCILVNHSSSQWDASSDAYMGQGEIGQVLSLFQ